MFWRHTVSRPKGKTKGRGTPMLIKEKTRQAITQEGVNQLVVDLLEKAIQTISTLPEIDASLEYHKLLGSVLSANKSGTYERLLTNLLRLGGSIGKSDDEILDDAENILFPDGIPIIKSTA